jgi:hypothetical protein
MEKNKPTTSLTSSTNTLTTSWKAFLRFFKGLGKLGKVGIVVLLLYIGYQMLHWVGAVPSIGSMFKAKPVVIDDTPIMITEIKKIAQLFTVTVYDEVVIDSAKVDETSTRERILSTLIIRLPVLSKKSNIVLIAKGKIMAGTDLAKLDSSAFRIHKDTVFMKLPKAIILDAIVNPSDIETFDETGTWVEHEVVAIKQRAKEKIIQRALQQGILDKANAQAKLIMENFLRTTGYKYVYVD